MDIADTYPECCIHSFRDMPSYTRKRPLDIWIQRLTVAVAHEEHASFGAQSPPDPSEETHHISTSHQHLIPHLMSDTLQVVVKITQ